MSTDVAVIVGSLRMGSFSRRVANALMQLAPAPLACEIVEFGDLPLYNQDLETDTPPAAWTVFRERMHRAQALLFVTPEYNRSIPGGLKNAVDVGSRPYGKSVWSGKPGAIVSCSPGAIGGFGANHHLRQPMVFLEVPMLQREAYLSGVDKLFEESGALVPRTREFLEKYMQAFAQWVARNLA